MKSAEIAAEGVHQLHLKLSSHLKAGRSVCGKTEPGASQSSWEGAETEQIERDFEGRCGSRAIAPERGDFDRLCTEWFVVHERVALRAKPSLDAEVLGVPRLP